VTAATRYVRARTTDEALSLLATDELSKAIAGGQSLVPMMSMGLARPSLLVDIGRLTDAPESVIEDGTVRLGLRTRHVDLERVGTELDRAAPMLATTAPWIAHPAIRSRGTFLGSLAHGDPAAEWPAVALALEMELELRSPRGTRVVEAADFFLGPLMTALEADELLVAARWRVAPLGTRALTTELALRHGDYAIVGVCAQVTPGTDGAGVTDGAIRDVADARIGLFAVDGTPIRAREAERAVVEGGRAAIPEAAALAAGACEPTSDVSATADYRRRMVDVHVRRALEALLDGNASH
jgi:carbon-monoxide dehydrogenase medium subunit